MSLFTHWVCFKCRKSFHKKPNEEAWKCSDCAKTMIDMGIYFEPPKRKSRKMWEIMQCLAENGYKFQTEGSKVFIDKFILGKNPKLKNVEEIVSQLKEKAI